MLPLSSFAPELWELGTAGQVTRQPSPWPDCSQGRALRESSQDVRADVTVAGSECVCTPSHVHTRIRTYICSTYTRAYVNVYLSELAPVLRLGRAESREGAAAAGGEH